MGVKRKRLISIEIFDKWDETRNDVPYAPICIDGKIWFRNSSMASSYVLNQITHEMSSILREKQNESLH